MVDDKDWYGAANGFEPEAELLLNGFVDVGGSFDALESRRPRWCIVELEVVAAGQPCLVNNNAINADDSRISGKLRHGALPEVGQSRAAEQLIVIVAQKGIGACFAEVGTAFGNDERILRQLSGFDVEGEFKAVGEERLEHGAALVVGRVSEDGGVEFCVDVEVGRIQPRRSPRPILIVVLVVGGLKDVLQWNSLRAGAVGGKPYAVALCRLACFDAGNLEDEGLRGGRRRGG